jgi:hypothetical protein
MAEKPEVELNVPFKYARMWPREFFYRRLPKPRAVVGSKKAPPARTQWLYKTMDLLAQPGVYVLYLEGVPYYVGQAVILRSALAAHARVPQSHYFRHWNYFSAFAADKKDLDRIEALLIAAMPTANGRKLLKKEPFPAELTEMLNEVQLAKANPELSANAEQAVEPVDGGEDPND